MTWLAVPHELAGFLSACLTRTLHNFLAQRYAGGLGFGRNL